MTDPLVIYKMESSIATLTLNRPNKLNAITPELEIDLQKKLNELEKNVDIRVIIIRGAGRAFCAGADLGGDAERGTDDTASWREAFLRSHMLLTSMLRSPKIIIAAVHGYVLGMGFYLAGAADILISTDDCLFGVPEIRHGQSSTAWLPPWNVSRNRLMEMLLTGDMIDGRKAEQMGLVNKAVPHSAFEKEVYRMARKLSLIDPLVLSMNKAAINAWYNISWYDMASLYSVENNTVLNASEPHRKWDEIFRKYGLREMIRKRDEPFKKLDEE